MSFIDSAASSFWLCGVWSVGCKVWDCLIMFGCFVNLWEVEGCFFKSLGFTGRLYRSIVTGQCVTRHCRGRGRRVRRALSSWPWPRVRHRALPLGCGRRVRRAPSSWPWPRVRRRLGHDREWLASRRRARGCGGATAAVATLWRRRGGRRRWPQAVITERPGSLATADPSASREYEKEGPEHRGNPALWWALAHKHAYLHAEATAGPSGQERRHAPYVSFKTMIMQLYTLKDEHKSSSRRFSWKELYN
jgi:hypothetical protein